MKRTPWLKYLPAILATMCFAPVALTQAYPTQPVHIAQSASEYDKYMRDGYAATAKRDYKTALVNFRKAEKIRPGDRYATNAIRNVTEYASRGRPRIARVIPTGTGSPGARIGAGTRTSGSCLTGAKPLTALVPETQSAQLKTVMGLTVAEYPILLFYVPQNSAQKLELALVDTTNYNTYEVLFDNPRTPGIVSVSLSALKDSEGKSLPPLEFGKNYQWYFSIVCDSENRDKNEVVEGFVQRVEPEPTLNSELENAAPRDRVSIYVVNDIWYDSLATLYKLRQSNPNDSSLADEWANLLGAIELDSIAREPLVQQ